MVVQSTKWKTDCASKVHSDNNEGQALVLILLALAVVLTIVLYIISRSITDVSVATSENQAVSAFSAAEAGVEQALVVGSAPNGKTQVGGASYQANVTKVGSGVRSFVYPIEFNAGDSATLWLQSQDASPNFTGTTIQICWGKTGTPSNSQYTPAIEAILYYGNASTVKVFRAAFDPNNQRSLVGLSTDYNNFPNNFTVENGASCNINGQVFPFKDTVDLTGLGNPQFMVVRMFYSTDTSHPIGFNSLDPNKNFPSQGILVDSTGTSGQSNRKVQVFQGWPEVPNVFQYAIYSTSGVTQN